MFYNIIRYVLCFIIHILCIIYYNTSLNLLEFIICITFYNTFIGAHKYKFDTLF